MRFPSRNCVKNNDIPTQNDTKINGKIDEILIFYQNPPKIGDFKKNIFSTDFFTFYKNFHDKNFDIMSMQICLSFRFLVFLALVDIYEKRYRVWKKNLNFFSAHDTSGQHNFKRLESPFLYEELSKKKVV